MATKLGLYNDALIHLGERKLASLAEAREPRRALDDVYDSTLAYCLSRGFWNFAMRTAQVDSDAGVEPQFGYTYAFDKPSDWVRTYNISTDEYLSYPLLRVVDEAGYWYADVDPIWVKYVSNGVTYGMDLGNWPAAFAEYVAIRLAHRICARVTGSNETVGELMKLEKRQLAIARSEDAMNEPPGIPPTSSWANSRGGSYPRRDRWNGQLA